MTKPLKPRITGTLAPVKQPTEITYDPERGLYVVQRWESAGDNLGGIAAALQAGRTAHTWTRGTARSSIVATSSAAPAGYQDVTTDSWQILANEVLRDIFDSELGQAVEAAQAGATRKVKRDYDAYLGTVTSGDDPPSAAALAAGAGKLFALLIDGKTHYPKSQYVLRHTTTVSNAYAANISDSNVDKVYTNTQLFAECQNANLWAYPMPGRIRYKIERIEAETARADYLWGWLKKASQETTAAGGRIEISTEYWLDLWPVPPLKAAE